MTSVVVSFAYSVFSGVRWNSSVIELSEAQTGDGENKMEARDT